MKSALQIPCYYQLRFGADPDEATAAVPSCCVWTQSGLTTVPHNRDSASAELAVRHIAGDPLEAGLNVMNCLLVPEDVSWQTMVTGFDTEVARFSFYAWPLAGQPSVSILKQAEPVEKLHCTPSRCGSTSWSSAFQEKARTLHPDRGVFPVQPVTTPVTKLL